MANLGDRCFCYFTAAMLVSLRGAQTWRLHAKLYKFEWNTSPNNGTMKNRTDLNLDEFVYISIIFHIPASWLNSLNGYDFYFWWRDTANQPYANKERCSVTNLKCHENWADSLCHTENLCCSKGRMVLNSELKTSAVLTDKFFFWTDSSSCSNGWISFKFWTDNPSSSNYIPIDLERMTNTKWTMFSCSNKYPLVCVFMWEVIIKKRLKI